MNDYLSKWFTENASADIQRLYEKFGVTIFARSSVIDGLDLFLNSVGVRGSLAVEIGTFRGLPSVILSRYFERVITLDIVDEPMKYEAWGYLGINNITFHHCPTPESKAEVLNALDFDFAFSDGDHAHDTQADFELVRRCGRVLFHEYWPLQPPVWDLVNQLRSEGHSVQLHRLFALWTAAP